MKITTVLYNRHKSLMQLIDSIDWLAAQDKYAICDPNVPDHLLYVTESRYQKMISSLPDGSVKVLATPGDTRKDVLERFDVDESTSSPSKGTPHLNQWMSSNSKLFTLISGWNVEGSMINFKRNFELFFPIYYSSILNWLGLRRNQTGYRGIWKLSNKISLIHSTRGINNVILILKIALISVNQYLAGNPLRSTQDLGQRIRLIHGLPAFLPPYLRKMIRDKNISYIRVVTTLLASYKGFVGKWPQPSFDTIRSEPYKRPLLSFAKDLDPILGGKIFSLGLGNREFYENWDELQLSVGEFWRTMNPKVKQPNLFPEMERLPLIFTAGPNCSVSLLGAGLDLLAHYFDKEQILMKYVKALDSYSKRTMREDLMMNLNELFKAQRIIEGKIKTISTKGYDLSAFKDFFLVSKFDSLTGRVGDIPVPPNIVYSVTELKDFVSKYALLGKLAIKLEAAGKVRVFAISDYWTQWILKPLHDSMFDLLSSHPCDATFDQIGKVEEFTARNYSYIASFDLKSATDLIPQQIYNNVFARWLGTEVTDAWLGLLVNRDYSFFHKTVLGTEFTQETLRYTRGQPMGTLSSWSSLAIVHHFLVFLAAKRSKITNFRDYLVLGDDIVIANKQVALNYQKVCTEYGITIGLAKSYISETKDNSTFFQFASQDMLGKYNISPISLKEVLSASGNSYYFGNEFNLDKRLEFVNRGVRKGFINPLKSLASLIRYQSTPNEWRRDSKYLSNGLFPLHRMGLITSMLLNNYKLFKNIISFNTLVASLRGDTSIFTKNVNLSNSIIRNYLTCFVKELTTDINTKVLNIGKAMVSKPLQCKDLVTLQVYQTAMMAHNGNIAERYVSLRRKWSEVSNRILSNATLDQWEVLYSGVESQSQIWPQDILDLMELRQEVDNVLAKVEIQSTLSQSLNSKVPYLVKYHLTLITSEGFRNQGVKALSGGQIPLVNRSIYP